MADRLVDPAALRRRLRTELRRAREEAQKTQRDAADALYWSPSKIIRIEGGQVAISVTDLKALLDYYGVKDEERVDSLVAMARLSRRQPWSQYRDVVSPEAATYYGYEASSSIVRQWEPFVVPGLLQTEDYTYQWLTGTGLRDERQARRVVDARVERQELLSRERTPELFFLVSEAAVRLVVGGPEVMARQLERVLELGLRPDVTFRIMPFSAGAHAGLLGSFVLLEFPDPEDADVVYVESRDDAVFVDDDEQTTRYLEYFFDLERAALQEEESLDMVRKIISGLKAS
jgi:transcriptional regulator with XRE-family HTH domain